MFSEISTLEALLKTLFLGVKTGSSVWMESEDTEDEIPFQMQNCNKTGALAHMDSTPSILENFFSYSN